eukprot:c41214_g1_i1 orf=74-361(+)
MEHLSAAQMKGELLKSSKCFPGISQRLMPACIKSYCLNWQKYDLNGAATQVRNDGIEKLLCVALGYFWSRRRFSPSYSKSVNVVAGWDFLCISDR